jgi:hypothetical protein
VLSLFHQPRSGVSVAMPLQARGAAIAAAGLVGSTATHARCDIRHVALEPSGDLELPAIVIGRRGETQAVQRVDEAAWLAAFVHQCGGLACLQEPILGIVLPLAWNATSEDAALRVLHGFDALAADSPSSARVRQLPAELKGLHLTLGAPYHQGQLDVLEQFMSLAFRLPKPIHGVEAFIELADCDLMSVFEGWRALSTHAARDRLCDWRTGDWRADVARARTRWDGETVLDRALLGALATYLHSTGIDPSFSGFLVWVNSD